MTGTPRVTERPGLADGYGIEPGEDGLLRWSWAEQRLVSSPNYWVATTSEDGAPHVAPVWGAWVDGAVWFGSDPRSRKARNLDRDPRVAVNLESGDEAVIVHGHAEIVMARDMTGDLRRRIDDAYAAKYVDPETGEPFRMLESMPDAGLFRVTPQVVLGWLENDFARSATRWRFEA